MAMRPINTRGLGINSPYVTIPQLPIITTRAPTSTDFAKIGTEWINTTNDSIWILTNATGGSATWTSIGGPGSQINSITGTNSVAATPAGGTITFVGGSTGVSILGAPASGDTPGTLTISLGALNATSYATTTGNVTINNTAAAATAGSLALQKARGSGVITTGDTLGTVSFAGNDGTNQIVGASIVATNSGTVATNRIASNLVFYTHPDSTVAATARLTIGTDGAMTIAAPDTGSANPALTITGNDAAGNAVLITAGADQSALGVSGAGTVTIASIANSGTGTSLTVSNTNVGAATAIEVTSDGTAPTLSVENTSTGLAIDATGAITSDSAISGLVLAATGDAAGAAGTTTISNVVDTTQGAGTLTITSASGNPGTNTGFIKAYVNGVVAYIPYFATIAP